MNELSRPDFRIDTCKLKTDKVTKSKIGLQK